MKILATEIPLIFIQKFISHIKQYYYERKHSDTAFCSRFEIGSID